MKTVPTPRPDRTIARLALIAAAVGVYVYATAVPPFDDGVGVIASAVAAEFRSSHPTAAEADEPEDVSARNYCFGA